jgi:hypothetical protein
MRIRVDPSLSATALIRLGRHLVGAVDDSGLELSQVTSRNAVTGNKGLPPPNAVRDDYDAQVVGNFAATFAANQRGG